MKRIFLLRTVVAGLLLAACNGDDGGDGGVRGDGGDVPDAVSHSCLAVANFGVVTLGSQHADSGDGTIEEPDFITLVGALNTDPTPDVFNLELYKGYGVFQTTIMPGTYTIAGAELNYATCGLCPGLFTDYQPATMLFADQQYFATSGSVTISSITPNFTGSFSNLTFEEVTINPTTFESEPVPEGCTTAAMSGTFDVVNMYTP